MSVVGGLYIGAEQVAHMANELLKQRGLIVEVVYFVGIERVEDQDVRAPATHRQRPPRIELREPTPEELEQRIQWVQRRATPEEEYQ